MNRPKNIGITMPFTGYSPEDLYNTLKSISECSLPVEVFDAFLSEYARSKDLKKARHFAACEWDC